MWNIKNKNEMRNNRMESEKRIKKDTSPYLIFKCEKCGQYMYVKPSQKTKKCLRCRRTYRVSKIEDKLTIDEVEGMSAAVAKVKQLQNELATEELGTAPDLSLSNRFIVAADLPNRVKQTKKSLESKGNNFATLEQKFAHLLCELSKKYTCFPKYLIGLASIEYGIEPSELGLLIRQFINEGKLNRANGDYFRFKKEKNNKNKN